MRLKENLEKLPYFYEVAKLGSMKKAAEAIYITQPSLTKSIKTLEQALGVELFIRQPRGVVLTNEGKILFDYCHELFHSISDVEEKLHNPLDANAGHLRVGTYESIAAYFWPKFLHHFSEIYPKLNIELTTGRSAHIQSKLEQNELDISLIVAPKKSPNLIIEKIFEDSFFLYKSSDSKFKIETAPLILMPEAFSDLEHNEVAVFSQLQKRHLFKTSSLETVKELTQEGLGLGLLPGQVAKKLVKNKKLKLVNIENFPKNGIASHDISLAYLKQQHSKPLIELLIKEIKKSL